MWITNKDYNDFVQNCKIIYFQVDLPKLLDELFGDCENIDGITFNDLNNCCIRYYEELIASCPEDMSFSECIESHSDYPVFCEVLTAIHNNFHHN